MNGDEKKRKSTGELIAYQEELYKPRRSTLSLRSLFRVLLFCLLSLPYNVVLFETLF